MGVWSQRVLPVLVEKGCRSRVIREERARWIPQAHGDVLELGVGTGLNLAFYDARRVRTVTGIDPSAALVAKAQPRAIAAEVPVEIVQGVAEALPFEAGTFDSAVMTYTLCSVEDPARALAEIRRVLRPGGELYVIEHGLAPDAATARWQHRITPVWRRLTGNCHLDRDVAALLRDAGFTGKLETGYSAGVRVVSYTYQGTAITPPG